MATNATKVSYSIVVSHCIENKTDIIKIGSRIVLVHGPFPCGSHDRAIYCLGLKRLLMRELQVWADGRYKGDPTVHHRFLPGLNCEIKKEMARGRARHETINRRFTDWSVLRDVYCHDIYKHHLIFGTVAVLTQLEMLHGFNFFEELL
jgi:hypothetical protein